MLMSKDVMTLHALHVFGAKFDICFALHVHLDGNFGTFGLRRSEQNNLMEISQNASQKLITR